MKKKSSDKPQHHDDELLAEYSFDYQKAKPNRFVTPKQAQEPDSKLENSKFENSKFENSKFENSKR